MESIDIKLWMRCCINGEQRTQDMNYEIYIYVENEICFYIDMEMIGFSSYVVSLLKKGTFFWNFISLSIPIWWQKKTLLCLLYMCQAMKNSVRDISICLSDQLLVWTEIWIFIQQKHKFKSWKCTYSSTSRDVLMFDFIKL